MKPQSESGREDRPVSFYNSLAITMSNAVNMGKKTAELLTDILKEFSTDLDKTIIQGYEFTNLKDD
jgi:hypothetical protein